MIQISTNTRDEKKLLHWKSYLETFNNNSIIKDKIEFKKIF